VIKFNCPQSLDGALLIQELKAVGVIVKTDSSGVTAPFIDGAGDLYLDIAETDKTKAAEIVANHQAI